MPPVIDVIARLLAEVDDIAAMATAAGALNDREGERADRLIANANVQRARLLQLIGTLRAARGLRHH